MTAAEFRRETGVSRETLARLEAHLALLRAWQPRINLVGEATLDDPWRRHMLDSAQLLDLAPARSEGPARRWVDLGSGAGFPGMVLAILGAGEVHLVESDRRKAAFLAESARRTGARATIHNRRAEELDPFAADVVTARALAPLARLLALAWPFIAQHTVCLFPKGRNVEKELTEARKNWTMSVEYLASRSDPSGTILRLRRVANA